MTKEERADERAIKGLRDLNGVLSTMNPDKRVDCYPIPLKLMLDATFRAMGDTSQEAKRWKAIALYLADCHAANAECPPKSLSKYNRGRYKSILEKAVLLIKGVWPDHSTLMRKQGDILKRCEQAIEELD